MMVQDPAVASDVRAAVDRYEIALMTNDLDALDACFCDSPQTVRFGVAENLYGFEAIAAFRLGRSGGSPPRERLRTDVVALGPDAAVANVEFTRTDTGLNGRQTQVWIRVADEWKIISAHVSLRREAADQRG